MISRFGDHPGLPMWRPVFPALSSTFSRSSNLYRVSEFSNRARPSSSSAFSSPSTKDAGERGAKFAVEYGVDERIQRRVAVTQPEEDGE